MIKLRVMGFVNKQGKHVDSFSKADTVMMWHLGRQHSVMAKRKEFKKAVVLNEVVERYESWSS